MVVEVDMGDTGSGMMVRVLASEAVMVAWKVCVLCHAQPGEEVAEELIEVVDGSQSVQAVEVELELADVEIGEAVLVDGSHAHVVEEIKVLVLLGSQSVQMVVLILERLDAAAVLVPGGWMLVGV